jgi:hypothetical protein
MSLLSRIKQRLAAGEPRQAVLRQFRPALERAVNQPSKPLSAQEIANVEAVMAEAMKPLDVFVRLPSGKVTAPGTTLSEEELAHELIPAPPPPKKPLLDRLFEVITPTALQPPKPTKPKPQPAPVRLIYTSGVSRAVHLGCEFENDRRWGAADQATRQWRKDNMRGD